MSNNINFRGYFFGNMYLSSIQQGIQSAHVVHDMFVKYPDRNDEIGSELWRWAADHKTMILLNAGYGSEIHDLVKLFKNRQNPHPWACFCESPEALDGAITSVGIILPDAVYVRAAQLRSLSSGEKLDPEGLQTSIILNKWQIELASRIASYPLAS